ncbi:MAG: hypothetical protein M1825_001935 [Sarcosagium campestre]|nr:MAG: hypothetical protein M1825_001935 [Sarcosagium campestre]
MHCKIFSVLALAVSLALAAPVNDVPSGVKLSDLNAKKLADISKISPALGGVLSDLKEQNTFVNLFYSGYAGDKLDKVQPAGLHARSAEPATGVKLSDLNAKKLADISKISPALGGVLSDLKEQNTFVNLFYSGYAGDKLDKVQPAGLHARSETIKIPHLSADKLAALTKVDSSLGAELAKQNTFVDLFYRGYGSKLDQITNPAINAKVGQVAGLHPRGAVESIKIPHLSADKLAALTKVDSSLGAELAKQNTFVDLFYRGYGSKLDQITNPAINANIAGKINAVHPRHEDETEAEQ